MNRKSCVQFWTGKYFSIVLIIHVFHLKIPLYPPFPKGELMGLRLSPKGGWGGFDAEVLLSLYEAKKVDLLSDVDGSYALAVWDGQDGKLLLIRDRVGCKPLFYLVLPDAILFASEIKAILVSGLYKPAVNLRALNNFLSYGYIPGLDTLFESIRQVRPGHILICKDGNVVEKPYWKFTYRQDEPGKTEAFYKERFLEIFETAVYRRLKRHPDAGAFLSGGLDTSGAVAVMRKLKGAPFKVFTAGFEEEKYNEIGDAKIVADYLGLEHHTVTVKFDKDFPALLEKLVSRHDAPFADTSAIPSYYAAKLAKEYVDTVFDRRLS
jgi:asparagine synthase (glutamine-hydrolysing)